MGFLDRILGRDVGPAANDPDEAVDPEPILPSERRPVWGRPAFCPECQKRGYLDRIDPVNRLMYQHCPACFHKWIISEADTEDESRPL